MSNIDGMASPKGSRRTAESVGHDSMLKKIGIKETTYYKLPLQYNERNLVKMIDLPNQLSGAEKEILNELIKMEKLNYKEIANQRFDSKKNWSIMIRDDCNDERNKIMRDFKFA